MSDVGGGLNGTFTLLLGSVCNHLLLWMMLVFTVIGHRSLLNIMRHYSNDCLCFQVMGAVQMLVCSLHMVTRVTLLWRRKRGVSVIRSFLDSIAVMLERL